MVAPAVACTGRGVLTEVGPLVDNMEPGGAPHPSLALPPPHPPRPAGHIHTWATAFPSGDLVPRGV